MTELLFPELAFYCSRSRVGRRRRKPPLGRQLVLFHSIDYARYTLRKNRQTPAWSDPKVTLAFYKEAARLTRATGVPHVVDHIVPLNGRGLVCGLHCPANLQVVTWRQNAAKGAWWWPDMPTDQLCLAFFVEQESLESSMTRDHQPGYTPSPSEDQVDGATPDFAGDAARREQINAERLKAREEKERKPLTDFEKIKREHK